MNKQKLISVLQSRIAKRKVQISFEWFIYSKDNLNWTADEKKLAYLYARQEGIEQKLDKALLKLVQSPFDAGFAVGYQEACKAVKQTLEDCECQN